VLFLNEVVRKENKITLLSYQKHINISFNNDIILTKYGSSQLCEQKRIKNVRYWHVVLNYVGKLLFNKGFFISRNLLMQDWSLEPIQSV